jgi:hypothetical protein
MATIYRIIRSDAASPATVPVGAAGAVVFGAGEGELVSHDLGLLKDGAIVPIRHPNEREDLAAHGENLVSASAKGILLDVDPSLCRDRGATVHRPTVSLGLPLGCATALVVGIILVIVDLARARAWGAAFDDALGWCLLVFLSWWVLSWLARALFFRRRARQIRVNACPACGCRRLAAVAGLQDKSLTLKNGAVVRVSVGGRS